MIGPSPPPIVSITIITPIIFPIAMRPNKPIGNDDKIAPNTGSPLFDILIRI